MKNKNDKSKYSFRYTIPFSNLQVNLTETYLTTNHKQITLQNTGSKEWPIGTMLKSHENNVITFKDVILNSRYEISPNASVKAKIFLFFPGDIEPGDYCVVVKVVLSTGEIIGDFFFSVIINDDKRVNYSIRKHIFNTNLNENEVKEKKTEKIVGNYNKPKEQIDLEAEIERLKHKNILLKNAFQSLKQGSESRYNRILREFREVFEEKEQLKKKILPQKGNNENTDKEAQEKKILLEEISKINQEKEENEKKMTDKIKLLTQEKNRLILLLNDEKKKVEELEQKKKNEILVLVNKQRKEEEENQKILDDLYEHIEVLEVQKNELKSENEKLIDKNKKHLNEFIKQKTNLTKENAELKSTIEIMKQNQLDKHKLITKDFQINKVNNISLIRTEQNDKISNNEKLFIVNPYTFMLQSKNASEKNIIRNEINIQICKNKENKENDIIQGDLNEKYNKKEIVNDNTNNKEQEQINDKKELTKEEIKIIYDILEQKFQVSSIFKEEEIIKCIINGNGDYEKTKNLLFY